MSRPYPGGRRNWKGRPPPRKHRGPRPGGYTAHGSGAFYDALLPDVRGPARRKMLNEIGGRSAILAALTCGALGLSSAGIVGAVVGLGAGFAAAHGLLVGGRFIRR